MREVTPKLKAIGLVLSTEKSIGIHHPNHQPTFESIPSTGEGALVLGSPIGTTLFIQDTLRAKCSQYTKTLDTITLMDANLEFPLLQESINTRPTYFLRLIRPSLAVEFASTFDDAMNKAIAVITKCPNSVLPAHSIQIRSLPFVLGGLGIKSAMNTPQDAYIASTQYSFNFLGWRNPYYWELCQPKNDEYVKLYFDLIDPNSGTDSQEIDDTLHATEIKDEDVIQDLVVSQQVL